MKHKCKRGVAIAFATIMMLSAVLTGVVYATNYTSKIVRVGYFDFAGFNETDTNGRRSGYGYDYLQAIAKYTGWKYDYVNASWEECQEMLAKGEIDILGSAQKTPEREEKYDFASLESGISYAVLCVDGTNVEYAYEDYRSFNGMRIGLLQGNSRNAQLEQYAIDKGFTYASVFFDTQQDLIEALHSGSVDAILTSNLRRPDNERIVAKFSPSPFYFMVPKGADVILKDLDYAQSQIRLDNPYFNSELYDNHYANNSFAEMTLTKNEKQYIISQPKLKAVYVNNFAPIEYANDKGEFVGITSGIMSEISKNTGFEFEYISVDNIADAVEYVKSGKADIICGVDMDNDAAEKRGLVLTQPYLTLDTLIVTNPHFTSKKGIGKAALVVDYMPELNYKLAFDAATLTPTYYSSVAECFEALKNSEVEATYSNAYTARVLKAQGKYSQLNTSASFDVKNKMSIAISRETDPTLTNILIKAISNISVDELDSIVYANTLQEPKLKVEDFIYKYPSQSIITIVLILAFVISVLVFFLMQRSKNNRKIYEILYLNSTTKLWNYNKFRITAQKVLNEAGDNNYALVYTDIDHFKDFNNTYGYEMGDELLKYFANCLKELCLENEPYGNITSDHFVALLRFTQYEDFQNRLKNFENKVNDNLNLKVKNYKMILTTGIYVIAPNTTCNITTALDCANSTRKIIKGSHKSCLAFYDDKLREKAMLRNDIETEMANALATGEFVTYLQPQFDMKTLKIVGMEALVRWINPSRGMMSPILFIPVFEQNGFIVDLDYFMFENTCKILSRWKEEGIPCVPIATNFSRLHLNRQEFVGKIVAIADKYNVPHKYLHLEVTESVVGENETADRLIDVMRTFKDLDFCIAMDDFGSGYSSLNVLNNMPVDILKLDKDFLQKSCVGEKERIIIEGFVDIAKKLNMIIVCEGIETEDQAKFLRNIGCHVAQGYLYAKPMPVADAELLLVENHKKLV